MVPVHGADVVYAFLNIAVPGYTFTYVPFKAFDDCINP